MFRFGERLFRCFTGADGEQVENDDDDNKLDYVDAQRKPPSADSSQPVTVVQVALASVTSTLMPDTALM